jgi:hypothetical protein
MAESLECMGMPKAKVNILAQEVMSLLPSQQ